MNERDMYAFLHEIDAASLDDDTIDHTLALILDHFGCALFGAALPWTRQVTAVNTDASPAAGTPVARAYAAGTPLTPRTAALVNGTAAHAFDLDDLHYPTMTHPGAVVISAAIAVADAHDAMGIELISALVAGYEVVARTGRAVGLGAGELGFHLTALCGALGAAAAASRLTGGTVDQLASAVGIAASLGSGIKAFQHGPGEVKRLHTGRAAESGVLAAALARSGFAGPRDALTGRFGFVPIYRLGRPDGAIRLDGDHGWAVSEIYIKPFAACGALHGLIAAAESLSDAVAPRIADVEAVVIGAPSRVLEQNDIPAPSDALTAQYSAQFAAAAGLLGCAREPASFLPETGLADRADALLSATRVVYDEQADRAYPDSNQGRITVTFGDGSTIEAFGAMNERDSRGWAVASQKFDGVTAGLLPDGAAPRVRDAVRDLADGRPVRHVIDAITASTSGG